MTKSCHWRVNTAETDFYGGKTKAQARKRQQQIFKSRGVKGRLVKHCESAGGKSRKSMPALVQWGIIAAAGVGLWMVVK